MGHHHVSDTTRVGKCTMFQSETNFSEFYIPGWFNMIKQLFLVIHSEYFYSDFHLNSLHTLYFMFTTLESLNSSITS
jgi:hypothetical protein